MNTDTTYREWTEENKEILKVFQGKKLFLMYSGGKDSSLGTRLF
jgi:PP-loop superfamily ATP-utilizing enzyme